MTTPVVLVTGALTGIGRATASAFAREGARVVVSGRRDDEGQKLAAELQQLGAEAEFVQRLASAANQYRRSPTAFPGLTFLLPRSSGNQLKVATTYASDSPTRRPPDKY